MMYDIWEVDDAIQVNTMRETHDRIRLRIIVLPTEILERNMIVTFDMYICSTNKLLFFSAKSKINLTPHNIY